MQRIAIAMLLAGLRHVLGQTQNVLPLVDALDRGSWIILDVPRGRLGDHAATLAGLFVTYLTRAIFARRSHRRVSMYLDELQNVIEHSDTGAFAPD